MPGIYLKTILVQDAVIHTLILPEVLSIKLGFKLQNVRFIIRVQLFLTHTFFAFFKRTVPTKYKGFCARLGPCRKGRSLQGLLESTRNIADISIFLKEKKERIFLYRFPKLEFAFTYGKANTFKKILTLLGKW